MLATHCGTHARQVILVAGLPCAGKTSLAIALAESLGAHAVSLGDLIRSERAAASLPREVERAFQGECAYPSGWVAQLVARRVAECPSELLVLDAGGPPIDEVAAGLDAELRCALILTVSEAERRRRFAARSHSAARGDDRGVVFDARSQYLSPRVATMQASLARIGPTACIDADGTAARTLRLALQALHAADLTRARGSLEPALARVPAAELRRRGCLQAAWASTQPATIVRASGDGAEGCNELVLLFKPGVSGTPAVEAAVLQQLDRFGCVLRGIAVWSRTSGLLERLAAAHLGFHHAVAVGGARALEPEQLRAARSLAGDASTRVLSGFEFERRFGVAARRDAWRDEGRSAAVRKLGPYAWACSVANPPCTIVNGHVPEIVRAYGEADRMMALAVSAPPDCPVTRLRDQLLGATDPGRAAPGSLRRMAADDLLGLGWKAGFRNNGFHLSEDAAEGAREQSVWFDGALA